MPMLIGMLVWLAVWRCARFKPVADDCRAAVVIWIEIVCVVTAAVGGGWIGIASGTVTTAVTS
jgi:hypothetical protein